MINLDGGCEPHCACLTDQSDESQSSAISHSGRQDGSGISSDKERCLVMGKDEAVYFFSADEPRSCYGLEGKKKHISWFRNYLIVVCEDRAPGGTPVAVVTNGERLTIYDLKNKYVAFNMTFRPQPTNRQPALGGGLGWGLGGGLGGGVAGSAAVVSEKPAFDLRSVGLGDGEVRFLVEEWGCLLMVTSTHRVYQLLEKDTDTKLQHLFNNNLCEILPYLVCLPCLHVGLFLTITPPRSQCAKPGSHLRLSVCNPLHIWLQWLVLRSSYPYQLVFCGWCCSTCCPTVLLRQMNPRLMWGAGRYLSQACWGVFLDESPC